MSNQPFNIDFLVADKLTKGICFCKIVHLIFVVLPRSNRAGYNVNIRVCVDGLMKLKKMIIPVCITGGSQLIISLRMTIRRNTRLVNE